jgi:multisubunit Na+/H+ antiporter MnhB subunit
MIEVLALLILLTVIAAVITVMTSNLLYAVISLGAVGFLLAIVFLFLAAPDIAIVQIGVEVVSLVILIRATLGRDEQMVNVTKPLVGVAFAVAMVAVIGLFGLQVFNEFPQFGIPVMERFTDAPATTYLQDGLAETGAPNIVTAVLLDFRAWDTLGEATVLFCAALGTAAVLRRRARISGKGFDGKGTGGARSEDETS